MARRALPRGARGFRAHHRALRRLAGLGRGRRGGANRLARELTRRGYRQVRGPRGARDFSGVQLKAAEAAPESDGGAR